MYDFPCVHIVIESLFLLGAASPQAVKKLLALSETSKARPKAILPSTPSPLSKGHVPHSSNASAHQGQHHHHSLTNSVDLTAESSSVTSLPSTRKAQANNSGKKRGQTIRRNYSSLIYAHILFYATFRLSYYGDIMKTVKAYIDVNVISFDGT